jgi:hypothetical protein
MIRKHTKRFYEGNSFANAIKQVHQNLGAKTYKDRAIIANAMHDACAKEVLQLDEDFIEVVQNILDQLKDGIITRNEATQKIKEIAYELNKEEKEICDNAAYNVTMRLGKKESLRRM